MVDHGLIHSYELSHDNSNLIGSTRILVEPSKVMKDSRPSSPHVHTKVITCWRSEGLAC